MLKQVKAYWRKVVLLFKNRDNLPRCKMLDRTMDFVRHNDVKGDYFEFGVYAGTTFQYAYHAAKDRGLKNMNFHAFDSFEGFSKPKGHDDIGLVVEGTRSCSEKQFLDNVEHYRIPLSVVTTTKGWFSNTLEGNGINKTNKKLGSTKIAIAWLDADLYEPTILALNFITNRLQDGTVILFDNWFLFKGHPCRGERKALTEWQKNNPNIVLTPFYHFGWHGTSFIVNTPLEKE